MKRIDWLKAFVIVFCVVVLIGEVYAYAPAEGRYSSTLTADGDRLTYGLSVNGSHEYTAILLDNGDYTAVDTVYLYYDPTYASCVNEDVGVITGAMKMTQRYYLDQLARTLEYKGITPIYVNAAELHDILGAQLADGTAAGKGLAIMAGAIPDTVYGVSNNCLLDWISAGGSLYWAGNVLGSYVSSTTGLKTVAGGQAWFVGTVIYNSEDTYVHNALEYQDLFCYEYTHTMYSVKADTSSQAYLLTGYTDGEYATISLFQHGAGQVCVFGGLFSPKQVRDVATTICSGLCYCSQVIDTHDGIANRQANGTLDASQLVGNGHVYLSVGGYFCVYAKGYSL